MEILITGGACLGAVLGRFFRVLILIPVSALLIAFVLMKAGIAGYPMLNTITTISLLIASLELGYITGLISTDISSAAQSFRSFWTRPSRTTTSRPLR
jgi:hypothetical protein